MSEEINTKVLSDFGELTEKILNTLKEKEWHPLSVYMTGLIVSRVIDVVLKDSPEIIAPEKVKSFRKLADPLIEAVMNIAMADFNKIGKKEKK